METADTIEESLFADKPGGWVPDEQHPGCRIWQGETAWTRDCGRSLVLFSLGHPRYIENCLLPDGTRGTVQATMENFFAVRKGEYWGGHWRRLLADGSWRHGRIELRTIDGAPSVEFVDILSDSPPRDFNDSEAPDMEADMHRSDWFRSLAADDGFADELYAAMCNVDWVKSLGETGADTPHWSCTWRSSAGIVAELRDKGEEYLDFYCLGHEGHVSPRVAQALAELGWLPGDEKESEEQKAL